MPRLSGSSCPLPNINTKISSNSLAGVEKKAQNIVSTSIEFRIHEHVVILPDWMPIRGWRIESGRFSRNGPGYLRWNSSPKRYPRNKRAHRIIAEILLGRELTQDEFVHHMDFNTLNNSPENLIIMPGCLNPANTIRCPFTGRFLSREEYLRLFGEFKKESEEPDWVKENEWEREEIV